MSRQYPQSHITKVMVLDGLIFLCGLMALATPLIHGFYPADIETTSHVALGALICVLSVFRVLLAYGAAWMELPIFALGLIVFMMPRIMHMRWEEHYNHGHLIFGGAVMVLAVISALVTIPQIKNKTL